MHPLRAYVHRLVPLTEAEWAPLAAALRPRHLPRHAHFVEPGQSRAEIGLVLSGSLRLYYPQADGMERTTYFFFENHLLADCELVVFDYAVLRRLYDEFPAYERFGRRLAEYHLLGTDARLVEQLTRSPEQRYRQLLASGKTKILARIPQHLVANYLGITAVSLSRIRARVAAEDGAIS